ncbi:glycoside hydrolase family 2 TIM barrel-domain containing protein [Bacteroides faecichinchillae]|uniref:glycoside hydrolase family 2 TIM barrel-domain containing protein n=1 Tax=Bacteroides faecichinchillae TaxID=871325 RepID=UPI0035186848
MKRQIMNSTLIAFLTLPLSVVAQNTDKPEWNNEYVSGVNKEVACQIAIPFANEQQAMDLAIEESPYYKTLNGTWKFHWVADPKDRPQDFYRSEYDVSGWDDIKVPAPWQIEAIRHNKNWDKPLYCNVIYPFCDWRKVEWPNVIQPRPSDYTFATMPNPVGSYRREFTLPDSWKGRDVFIRFNGVEAGFYIWVNGKKVGYSEDSYLPAEFNLTPYLKDGKNILAVEVYRFTDGSFLECQDFWRFSGIFRDVFLWSAPKTQIRDFFFTTDLDKEFRNATVNLDVEVTGKKSSDEIHVKLMDLNGKEIAKQTTRAQIGTNHIEFEVMNPLKWTAETPNLYNLSISLIRKGKTTDIRNVKVGFRKIEFTSDGQMLINGKTTLFKGVDRHDHSSENGRTVSKEEMEKDVQLMKSFNVNAVRTSHYPNNPYFYDLCDKYGIYVLAEANVECHGLMALSHEPSWKKSFTERSEDMVRRYRNHPSIMMWSLGNESGNGINFKSAEEAVKKLDKTRPTHYEGNSSFCDVTSNMYPSVEWLENVGKERLEKSQKGEAVKPHVVCEYAHAMGNSMGNFREYWETYERYPALIGGFIWDWVDQSIKVPTPDGTGYYMAVGGDFGDKPNDGNFCTNGVIFSDRTYAPKALEVKKIHQPVRVEALGNGKYKVTNKRFHTGLDDLYGRYEIMEDGKVLSSGNLDELQLDAQGSKVITIVDPVLTKVPGAEYFIKFSFCQKKDTDWEKAGYEVASEQIKIADSEKPVFKAENGEISCTETEKGYLVKGERFEATFSKEEGTISSYVLDGVPLISKGLELNVFRAPTDNDKQVDGDWQRKGLYNMSLEPGQWEMRQEDGKVILAIKNTYRGKSGFDFQTTIEYTVAADGSILVNSTIIPTMNGEIIPRVGYRLELPEGFERMRWFGCGPFENYVDRKDASYVGIYDDQVSNKWLNYIRSQEMGNHEDVRWISITNPNGIGFVFVAGDKMSATALHARAQDMVDPNDLRKLHHRYEVPVRKETVLCLDAATRPLGNASCGPGPMRKYELFSQPTVFSFMMLPLERSYLKDELAKKARVRMPVSMPVLIERDNDGYLNLKTSTPGAKIYYSLNGEKYKEYAGAIELISGGKVQAYAVSENLGKSMVTSAEFPIYVDRSGWKIVTVSSENKGEEAKNAIDGDPNTIWHTRWSENEAKHPHEIIVDMASLLEIDQFIYQPRNSENGRIKDYELYFSTDGKTWGNKSKGAFENSSSSQIVRLEKPIVARYFKLVALSELFGRNWASVAELNVNVTKNLSGVSGSKQRVIYVDSDADDSMKLAADGNINTYWHTVHNQFYLAPYPHEIQMNLSKEMKIKGIKYTPRQDSSEGRIAKYEVYVSRDGKEWGKAVASGTFTDSKDTQKVEFAPRSASYVKLQALSACTKDDKRAAVAELEILVEE